MDFFNKNITDRAFVISLIPQKPPFVMVDKLLHYEEKFAVAGLTIDNENIFVENDVFTEPGLIEHMAQALALHSGYKFFLKNEKPPLGFMGAITKAEIFSLPLMDNELITTVEILHDIMGLTKIRAEIKCKDHCIATADMKTILLAS